MSTLYGSASLYGVLGQLDNELATALRLGRDERSDVIDVGSGTVSSLSAAVLCSQKITEELSLQRTVPILPRLRWSPTLSMWTSPLSSSKKPLPHRWLSQAIKRLLTQSSLTSAKRYNAPESNWSTAVTAPPPKSCRP